MFLWFAGVSVVVVWAVFKSPAIDYRLVMLGSVLPVGELLVGGPWILHTLVFASVLLFAVVLVTQGRRLARRRWIAVPIGMMLHLALDGTWAVAELFWWPFLGGSLGEGGLPETNRAPGLIVVLELIGLACLVWAYRRFGLDDPDRRELFIRTGHLDRSVVSGSGLAGSPGTGGEPTC